MRDPLDFEIGQILPGLPRPLGGHPVGQKGTAQYRGYLQIDEVRRG